MLLLCCFDTVGWVKDGHLAWNSPKRFSFCDSA